MWTSQVYGHHDKMARTKTHRTSQTRSIQRRTIHKEITTFLCFSDFSKTCLRVQRNIFIKFPFKRNGLPCCEDAILIIIPYVTLKY